MKNKVSPSVSVIIRSCDQIDRLRNLLSVLSAQEYDGSVQFVLVDTESRDGSPEMVRKVFGQKAVIITIRRDEFNYPRSLNMGAEAAAGDILICTVEHALPIRANWIASAVEHFADESVAGVYSPVIPNEDAGLAERLFYWPGYLYARIKGAHAVARGRMGTFGATNCALPRRLWLKHPFDERYGAGGEDGQWSGWAMEQGYKIVCDPRFVVRHSHGLGLRGLIKQMRYWSTLGVPRPFVRKELTAFRNDPWF